MSNIPPLILEGFSFETKAAVLVIWADKQKSEFQTVQAAKANIARQMTRETPHAVGARVFAWNETSWDQIYP